MLYNSVPHQHTQRCSFTEIIVAVKSGLMNPLRHSFTEMRSGLLGYVCMNP